MSTVWVYKLDGTLQCDLGNEIPLKEMQKELENLGAEVLSSEKRISCDLFSQACGSPTGRVNAYEISHTDWEEIKRGFVGPLGFKLWTCSEVASVADLEAIIAGDDPLPWPWAQATSVSSNPTLCRELIGRTCRCYTQGDALTKDFRPERVNIELDRDSRIADIWFG